MYYALTCTLYVSNTVKLDCSKQSYTEFMHTVKLVLFT